jgi:hypothetical protein
MHRRDQLERRRADALTASIDFDDIEADASQSRRDQLVSI